MKTLQCPLCGNELTSIFRMTKTGSLKNKYGCLLCGWETFELRKNENLAWKDAEEFISKFPPIMRVWPGDEVLWGNTPVTVLDKDIQCGELMVINSKGNKYIIEQHVIEKWPWELKQKGGDNGQ